MTWGPPSNRAGGARTHLPARLYWLAALGLWIVVAFVYALRPAQVFTFPPGAVASMEVRVVPRHAVFLETVLPLLWSLPLAPLIVWLGRRFRPASRHWWYGVLVHLAAAAVFAVFHASLARLIRFDREAGFQILSPSELTSEAVIRTLPTSFFIYWILLGISLALDSYKQYRTREREAARLALRASQLEAQLAEARLETLQMQLHPHFLFNTLHAISTLVDWKPKEAREMITSLSELLRLTLDNADVQEVTLQQELDWLDRYLEIQQIRFQDRLSVQIDVASETLSAKVPYLILQPMVENAIKHGVAARPESSAIAIRAERQGSCLHVSVWNDGLGLPVGQVRTEGIGLRNTRQRLRALYGDEQRVILQNAPGGGVESVLKLPFATPEMQDLLPARAVPGTFDE